MPNQADDMMDDFNTLAIRMLKVIVGVLLMAIFLLALGWWLEEPQPSPIRAALEWTVEEKRWVEERHRFHGISSSIEENGIHYFYRDGKRCNL